MKMIRPDELNYEDFRAEILVLLCSKKKILILEGGSDIKFFNIATALVKGSIEPYCVNNKEIILQLFKNTSEIQNNEKVVGVVDRDFDTYLGITNYSYDNLIATDFASIEHYYIMFSGFNNFIRERLNKTKIIKLLSFNPQDQPKLFIQSLHKRLKNLTFLRLVDKINSFCIPLSKRFNTREDKNNRHKKLDKMLSNSYIVDTKEMMSYLWAGGICKNIDSGKVLEKLNSFSLDSYNHLTNGHDLISILTCIYNKGNSPSKGDEDIETDLRLTITPQMFNEYPATKKIIDWVLNGNSDAYFEAAPTCE